MSVQLPVLYLSHGAPTFALEPGVIGARLVELGRRLPSPQAVLVISPHWMSREKILVTTVSHPETLHDFGGFPSALYQIRYPAPGAPSFAHKTIALLRDAGWHAEADPQRGLDHGAWVPLYHLLPDAQTPVFQVSLPYPIDPADALRLGKALSPLRDEGVQIVTSGSLTHNLRELGPDHGNDARYALEFTHWVRHALKSGDARQLLPAYRRLAPHAVRAHPTEEHFLPLLIALGASATDDPVTVIEGEITYGVLSMESYLFGKVGFDTTFLSESMPSSPLS